MPPASSSQRRPELSPASGGSRGGARKGTAPADLPAAFEEEFPGASWMSTRVFREIEEVGAMAEALVASVARRHGLSHAALNALAIIEGHGAPMPTGTVGAQMHITTGTMTSVIDTLERNGYIERISDPEDRRRVLVDVTPTAQTLLNGLLPEVAQTTTAALARFSVKELNGFLDILGRVRQAITAVPNDLGPPAPRRTPPSLKRS